MIPLAKSQEFPKNILTQKNRVPDYFFCTVWLTFRSCYPIFRGRARAVLKVRIGCSKVQIGVSPMGIVNVLVTIIDAVTGSTMNEYIDEMSTDDFVLLCLEMQDIDENFDVNNPHVILEARQMNEM